VDAKAMKDHLAADAKQRKDAGKSALPSVLLVYASSGLTYGDLMTFLAPVFSTHGTVYVFLEGAGQGGSGQ
jgi:hypothetical protein